MNETKYMGGKAEIAIGDVVIEPQFIESIQPEFEEGTRSVTSLAGVINTPSGSYDTAQLTFTMILPSMDALKSVFANIYEAGSGSGSTGRVVFGKGTCSATEPVPVNVHYTCEEDDANDFHIFAGRVLANFNPEYNAEDALKVEVTIYAMPTENGYAQAGTGDLTQRSVYDPTTQTWKAVSGS